MGFFLAFFVIQLINDSMRRCACRGKTMKRINGLLVISVLMMTMVMASCSGGGGASSSSDGPEVIAADIPSNVVAAVKGSTIELTWNGDKNDTHYKVVVSKQSDFKEDGALKKIDVASSPQAIAGFAAGTYYAWVVQVGVDGTNALEVAANNGAGIVVVSTGSTPPADPDPEDPEDPQNTGPADSPTNINVDTSQLGSGSVVVSWDGNANGGSYIVVIDDDNQLGNDSPVQTISGESSPLTIGSLESDDYYVWVIPVDEEGNQGEAYIANDGNALVVYNGTLETAPDNRSVYAGKSTIISAAALLANDANGINDEPLEIVEVKEALHGTVELDGSNVIFTSTGSAGVDAGFTYVMRIKDNTLFSAEGSVTLTVNPLPSLFALDDEAEVRQGETEYLTTSYLLSNDEGTDFSFVDVLNSVNCTVSVSGTTITFTSTALAYQEAQFDYRILDAQGTYATGTVVIGVTPLPSIEAFVFDEAAVFEEQKVTYAPPTMQNVFNTWARFDGNNYFENKDAEGISTNAAAWLFENDSVKMPLNVVPYNGFLSPQELENYTFEATVTSTYGDNDNIGLVIAFVRLDTNEDGEPDTNYSLTAMRTRGGKKPYSGWGVVYNEGEGLRAGDARYTADVYGRILEEKAVVAENNSNWSGAKTRIKIVRSGDIIRCYTTNWNTTDLYVAESLIEIDLNSDPDLHKFKGKKPYGYVSYSQPNSTYENINIEGGLDANTMSLLKWNEGSMLIEVWAYDNDTGAWVLDASKTLQEIYGYVREVVNPITGKRYLIKQNSVEIIE